ncbi:MAG: tRNA (adenosine(37)-N6)-dimethylallyltransferase MiaA [Chloroflexota bacterium]|nr:tRNA (adenosine(37)-N6)-dimethylallyltransferase MiaA [Chloroflexota bacterium]
MLPETPEPPLVAIVGPTASGKTALAVELCREIGGGVISADSRQVYRGMDIGTAKPTASERGGIDHHLLDIRTPDCPYSLPEFLGDANAAVAAIRSDGMVPVVVGGTALYVHALLAGFAPGPADPDLRRALERDLKRTGLNALNERLGALDSAAARAVDSRNPRRVLRALERRILAGRGAVAKSWPQHPAIVLGLHDRPARRTEKIARRTRMMLASGLTDEVRRLLAGYGQSTILQTTIGYSECVDYLLGRCDLTAAEQGIRTATNQYARRQMTYLRNKMRIQWLEPDRPQIQQALTRIGRTG